MESSVTTEQERSDKGLIVAGWVTALVIPFIGLVLGVVLATRSDAKVKKEGKEICCAAIGAFLVWVVILR
jgi:hypothetical protein